MIPTDILHDNAAIGDDIGILRDIHLKTKNLVVYKREIGPLKVGLAQAAQGPIECKAIGTVEEITLSLSTYFTQSEHLQEILLQDILNLLELFEQVTKVSSFQVLLASVSTNMCRRFHADINELRMLCTYHGPGTLWLPDKAVDRKAYLTGKGNQNIVPDESLVQQVGTGDVVILKGAQYPKATPILHRSPSIEKNGEERILLRIDINQSLEFPI
ncbi:MAG: DUF1826 domain-containing protein [Bacteroidota bacterium]